MSIRPKAYYECVNAVKIASFVSKSGCSTTVALEKQCTGIPAISLRERNINIIRGVKNVKI